MGHLVRAQAPESFQVACHCIANAIARLEMLTHITILLVELESLFGFSSHHRPDHDSRLNCQEDALWPIMISTRNRLCHYSYGYSARHH